MSSGWFGWIAVVLTVLAAVPTAGAQDEKVRLAAAHWAVDEGLPVQAVRRVVQTRDGYLWLATYDGLVRFDGHSFTTFDSGTTEALPSSRILYLFEAGDGSLWIHTENAHLVRYHEGAFDHFHPREHFGGADVGVYSIDPAGELWVGTSDGLYRFEEGHFVAVAPEVEQGEVQVIAHTSDGAVWVGTKREGALRFLDGRLTARTRRPLEPEQDIEAFWEGPDGTLWFRLHNAVGAYRNGRVQPGRTPTAVWADRMEEYLNQPVRRLNDPATGDLFLYVEGYPDLYDFLPTEQTLPFTVETGPRGDEWFVFGDKLFRDGIPVFTSDGSLTGLTFDHEGNLWLSSTAGLYQLSPQAFVTYGLAEGLAPRDDNAYPIIQADDGAIWVGTLDGGITRWKEGRTEHVYHEKSGVFSVLSLFEDPQGDIWAGYWNGLCRVEEGVCRDVTGPGLPEDVVPRALVDHGGTRWLGTESGVLRQDPETGTWENLTHQRALPPYPARVFFADDRGVLWVGTDGGGVLRYADDRFTVLNEDNGLSSDLVRSFYQDSTGVLWVGTENRGLNRVRLGEGGAIRDVTTIRREDGLFDDVIHQILEDDQGRFWMSSNRGIFHVRRKALEAFAEGRRSHVMATAYDERDGMRNREANGGVQSAGMRAEDGRLWFPTQEGVVVVDPSTVDPYEAPPPVLVEALTYADTTVAVSDAVALPEGVRRLEVSFAAPAFRRPEAVHFRHRLRGLDSDWIEAGSSRRASFTNLPPGTHRFEVQASRARGAWSDATAVEIRVPPYFFETRGFAVFVALAIIGLGVAVLRWRLYRQKARERNLEREVAERTRVVEKQKEQLRQQAARLRDLDEAKSRFFANVSHEFRTPLTLALGPLEDLQAGRGAVLPDDARADVEQALLNNRRLLRLVNQLLDVARLEAHEMRLHPRPVELGVFVGRLSRAFAGVAERKQIAFERQLPPDAVWAEVDPDQLEKVVSNLLSNAFKFTPEGGRIRLSLECGPDAVRLRVQDDGPGIAADRLPHIFDRFYHADPADGQAGTGIGLALARELVELHGGTIQVESREGFGATFSVSLPVETERRPRAGNGAETAGPDVSVFPRPAVGSFSVPSPDLHETDEASESDGGDRTTVLVVDDNAEIRAFVARHLDDIYHVEEAGDGTEGLERARELLPDLIISDVSMPGMDGYELVRHLHSDPATDFIPIILLTARAAPEDRLEGIEHGADVYLTKPFQVDELLARSRSLIAQRQRLRSRFSGDGSVKRTVEAADEPSAEDVFIEQLREMVEKQMADETFTVQALADAAGLDRTTLYRRLRAAADITPSVFIHSVRLERGAALLVAEAGNVSEVAYGVGYKSVSHFSKKFREHFGCPPSAYAEKLAAGEL